MAVQWPHGDSIWRDLAVPRPPGFPAPPGPEPRGGWLSPLPAFSLNQGPHLRPGSGENWFGGSRQGAVMTLVLDAEPEAPAGTQEQVLEREVRSRWPTEGTRSLAGRSL